MELRKEQVLRILNCTAETVGLNQEKVNNTIKLLLDNCTVPFIARYRKEITGELDEVQIRSIKEKFEYFTELEERKNAILDSIRSQNKLTPELEAKIESTMQKTELEDLYLPYKPKRRTKATIAKELGLEALADIMLKNILIDTPEKHAEAYLNPAFGLETTLQALEGAGHIIAERISEDADIREMVRSKTRTQGIIWSKVITSKKEEISKFEQYYDYKEKLSEIPSHRMLAIRRGEEEGFLVLGIEAPVAEILEEIEKKYILYDSIFKSLLLDIVKDAYNRLISPSIETELFKEVKKAADLVAIEVFAKNLHQLLLAAPAGSKRILAIDPGFKTGSKLVALDETGKFIETITIYPHTGKDNSDNAKIEFVTMLKKHNVEMITIGNGTASREMEQFVKETLAVIKAKLPIVIVNEAGASVYSASDTAREEFPDLDVTVRGAISIGRRLQDPLAELVKIEPKSIGVGQYQHDVDQDILKNSLESVVESCVNFVGVELNTASYALLSYVSGIGPALSKAIVLYRDKNGAFHSRSQLTKVSRFGEKAFEQAAGFLRIRNAENPLDNTAVHPERYALVEQMAADLNVSIPELISNSSLINKIEISKYVNEEVGLPTLKDIISELLKPGRDPRNQFKKAEFREDVTKISDLEVGMILNGVITNVTNFGAFIDIGVHQDGLVHLSNIADKFIENPMEVIKVGDIVTVKVIEVDIPRNRISLTMRDVKIAEKSKEKSDKNIKNKPNKPKNNNPFDVLDSLLK